MSILHCLVSNGKNIFLICFSESMKVNTNPSKTKEWRQVEVEEDFKIGWKKFVLFKGDIPSKKIEYEDPKGNRFKDYKSALKKLKRSESKALKADNKLKGNEGNSRKRKAVVRQPDTRPEEDAGEQERTSPPKRRSSMSRGGSGNVLNDEDFLCGDCKTQFGNAIQLAEHKSKFHKVLAKPQSQGKNQFQCGICGFEARSKSKLKKHEKKDHGLKGKPQAQAPRSQGPPGPALVSKIHKEKFKIKELTKPQAEVKNLPQFLCEICNFDAGSRSKLKKHKKMEHDQKARAQPPAPRSRGPPGPEIECEVEDCFCEECGLEFGQRSLLETHMRNQHKISNSPPPNPPMERRQTRYFTPIKKSSQIDFDDYYGEDEEELGEEEFSSDEEELTTDPDIDFFDDDEEEPEEITLDGDDEEEDYDHEDDIIIEEVKPSKEEEERRLISDYEKLLSSSDLVLKCIEDPDVLQDVSSKAWWAQPSKWKPTNTWEVWNAKVGQLCAHYRLRDLDISPQDTFNSYQEFDRRISQQLLERNPGRSARILYSWKKAKWFSLLDPIIPDHMKFVEETLEDDD